MEISDMHVFGTQGHTIGLGGWLRPQACQLLELDNLGVEGHMQVRLHTLPDRLQRLIRLPVAMYEVSTTPLISTQPCRCIS